MAACVAIGHRGAAGHLPENTLGSFEKALELGADAIEFDVALTRDGAAVILHDDTLERTTDGEGAVEQAMFDDVRRLDAGKGWGVVVRIPTLAEVLDSLGGRTLLNLEMKVTPRRCEMVETCLAAVRERGLMETVLWSSFDHGALRLLRVLEPEARIAVLCEVLDLAAALRAARELHAENLHPPAPLVTTALAERAHAQGLRLWAWTANEPREIERLLDAGVDGLFSDFPERVVAARARRGG